MDVRGKFDSHINHGVGETAAALLVVAESIQDLKHEHEEIAVATLRRLDAIHTAMGDVVVTVQELKAALP